MSELFSINSDDTVVSDALLGFVNAKKAMTAQATPLQAPASRTFPTRVQNSAVVTTP